jgi:hypothetical protein
MNNRAQKKIEQNCKTIKKLVFNEKNTYFKYLNLTKINCIDEISKEGNIKIFKNII